jgi:signal peptidase II
MKKKSSPFFTGLVVAILILAFDQWSKKLILELPQLTGFNPIEVTSFFNLVLVMNRGVSFGMFSEHDQPLILTGVAVVIICILLTWLWRNSSLAVALGIGSVIGGAIGNVIDRIRYGAVVDFLDFHIAGLHWPAFNVADSFVFIGVVVLCIYSMFFEKKTT